MKAYPMRNDSHPLPPTGSAIAFGKLHGLLDSAPLNLPGKNAINITLAGGSLAAAAVFLTSGDPVLGLQALVATSVMGGVLGAHMTASIGGIGILSLICIAIVSGSTQETITIWTF